MTSSFPHDSYRCRCNATGLVFVPFILSQPHRRVTGWTDEDERSLHCYGKGGVTMFVHTSDPILRANRTYVVIVPPGEIAIPVSDASASASRKWFVSHPGRPPTRVLFYPGSLSVRGGAPRRGRCLTASVFLVAWPATLQARM